MSQYIASQVQYAKNTRMFYYMQASMLFWPFLHTKRLRSHSVSSKYKHVGPAENAQTAHFALQTVRNI